MTYLLLAMFLSNMYFSIKRYDISFVTTLNTMCLYIVIDCLALIVVLFATFVDFISGKNVVVLIICILAALVTVVFDALIIHKYVKIKTDEKEEK